MTPPTRLAALPNPSLGPPITAGQLLKPVDFTSTQTIFLFPPMSSKLKGSTSRAPDPIDDAFYVTPTPSKFWAAFNHSGSRLFVNVLRKLSANVQIPATVATNHSPKFYMDESGLILGIRTLTNLTLDYLNGV